MWWVGSGRGLSPVGPVSSWIDPDSDFTFSLSSSAPGGGESAGLGLCTFRIGIPFESPWVTLVFASLYAFRAFRLSLAAFFTALQFA